MYDNTYVADLKDGKRAVVTWKWYCDHRDEVKALLTY